MNQQPIMNCTDLNERYQVINKKFYHFSEPVTDYQKEKKISKITQSFSQAINLAHFGLKMYSVY
jgi:hypothetical protein